jgi:hypothetical protein
MNSCDLTSSQVRELFSRVLKAPVISVARLWGGRNTQVYRLLSDGGQRYAGKIYFQHQAETRDRLGTEFSALRFLWDNGVRSIPMPVAADASCAAAVYEFIRGVKITAADISEGHIRSAVDFTAELARLRTASGSTKLPPASHAVFSYQGYIDYVEARLRRFQEITSTAPPYRQLRTFIDEHFVRRFRETRTWCREEAGSQALLEREIDARHLTLSPSDFGFHNALLTEERGIVFLDFEYFGWDDPTKMICDFLLHPAMDLSRNLGRRFLDGTLGVFRDDEGLAERVRLTYPLAGLAWCLIFLNELLPEHAARRRFSAGDDFDLTAVQFEQLAKSERMLERIVNEYRDFPYRIPARRADLFRS